MNRRGFIALATAAAVAPQELIAAPEPAPILDAAAIGSAYTKALAQSLLQTKEMVAIRYIAPSYFLEQLREILNEEFGKLYAAQAIAWEDIFKDEETLAREERGRDPALCWEEAGPTPEDVTAECRGVGSVHRSLDAGEGFGSDLREFRQLPQPAPLRVG